MIHCFYDINEMFLYIQNILMNDFEEWVAANNVHFVDVIEAMDQDRDLLSSWVHLAPEGNQVVAGEFADIILELVCRENENVAVK